MQLGTVLMAREALQLLLALGLGGMVGLERRLRGHPAGIHTEHDGFQGSLKNLRIFKHYA
jgi:hypothetical protein